MRKCLVNDAVKQKLPPGLQMFALVACTLELSQISFAVNNWLGMHRQAWSCRGLLFLLITTPRDGYTEYHIIKEKKTLSCHSFL